MKLTTAQQATLAAYIAANFAGVDNTVDASQPIADALNANAAPDFYAWRSFVSENEIVGTSGVDVANGNAATTWSWTAYIARSIQELTAWGRMMMTTGGSLPGINPSRANIRQGVADIFSGSANSAPAQRTHMLVLSKRKARQSEKLLADITSGSGTFAAPATLGTGSDGNPAEGTLSASDVWTIRNPNG